MIAVLQFDGVSLPHLNKFVEEDRLPAFSGLRGRGQWLSLDTPAASWEGATYFTLYSGRGVAEHGLYFPFMWSAAEQRVRPQDHLPAPEPVWDRIGNLGLRSLIIDPYEGSQPRSIKGKAICGWQFRHNITLRGWCVPPGLDRDLQRRFGRPSLVEEVYGRPSRQYLSNMRKRLLSAPQRAAQIASAILAEESFDLVWITLSSSHIAGHWFLDPSRLPQEQFDLAAKAEVNSTLADTYAAVDRALSDIITALPPGIDIIVLSPTGMVPSTTRTHLLPRMLRAVLSASDLEGENGEAAGNSLWRLRGAIPTGLRAWVARVLPNRLTLDLTARLETKGVDWNKTRAFMVPSGDCGYIRLNLKGRERDGIVEADEASDLLERIAKGLKTFRDTDGEQAVDRIECVQDSLGLTSLFHPFPDLIVHWSDRVPPHLAGVQSSDFGAIPSPGWGSGRTGEHCDGAWALVVPARARLAVPMEPLHIMDVVPTICAVLDVPSGGLAGRTFLVPSPAGRN